MAHVPQSNSLDNAVCSNESTHPDADDVRASFHRRIESAQHSVRATARTITRVEGARLVVFLSLPTLLYYGYEQGFNALLNVCVLACSAGFLGLVRFHSRLEQHKRHFQHIIDLNDDSLARMDRDFTRLKPCPAQLMQHVCKQDLDINLFGPSSLGQLLFNQSTHLGHARIAQWFSHPIGFSEIVARQQAINELRPLLDHRQALSAYAAEINAGQLDLAKLISWIKTPRGSTFSPGLQIAGYGLTGLTLMCAVAAMLQVIPAVALVGCVAMNLTFYAITRTSLQAVFEGAEDTADALNALSNWMTCFSQQRYESPLIKKAQQRVFADGKGPVLAIKRLDSILGYVRLRYSPTISVFAQALLNWDFHTARATYRWKRAYQHCAPAWLDAMADIESLCAFASLACENPTWTFPTGASDPRIVARAVVHPLIKPERAVANDVELSPGTVVIITGSNMSGKTTYMRTVALNLRLAQVGSVVAASSFVFNLAPLVSSISVADSLDQGLSYFMSEALQVKRVITTAASQSPVVFLLDELLKGTNERERNLAIVEILQTLCAHQAMGLITTHNVALATSPALAGCARNIYFEEAFDDEDGPTLRFTYRLKAGVSENTNALRLLRAMKVLGA